MIDFNTTYIYCAFLSGTFTHTFKFTEETYNSFPFPLKRRIMEGSDLMIRHENLESILLKNRLFQSQKIHDQKDIEFFFANDFLN